ncbi:TRAP transporter large permease [Fodinicurvata halophila]|uniref:TRAP transporter large permease n=1 Tax=Fodinicurvata halophila TaxID=1419723 RepID=UPI0036316D77
MTIPLDILMFAAMIGAILLGYPVALTIAGVAVIFAGVGVATGAFDSSLLGALGQRVFGVLTNTTLIAIPLFVFMGVMLEKSRIAEDLLEKMGRLFGPLPGGLGVSVVIVGALLAASTGIVGATVVAMGLIALPTMLRNGYDRKLASGIICTAGTLGQIIPPSTLLIILADVMSNAYQQAQYEEGKFSVSTLSVGQIFAAALMPGLLMVALYIIYLLVRAWWLPNDAPPLKEKVARPSAKETLLAVVPPILLIIAVLGSVLGGVATATEAASVGAVGAMLLAGYRMGGPARLIALGAFCFLVLAIAAGAAPVRLQRTDTGLTELLQGIFYGVLMLGVPPRFCWPSARASVRGS